MYSNIPSTAQIDLRYRILNNKIESINKNLINKCAMLTNKCSLLENEMNYTKSHNEHMKRVLNEESSRINNFSVHHNDLIFKMKILLTELEFEVNRLNSEVRTKDIIINNLRKQLNYPK
jgi:hypothetical protein